MKAAGAALAAHLGQEVTSLATLWRVTRKDGQQYFFTDHDADLAVGAETYQAAASYERSALRAADGMAGQGFELTGIIDSALITETDLIAGKFDRALVEIFAVNWASPGDGTVQLKRGRLGKVALEEPGYRVEFRDLADQLETAVGEVYAADCIVDLGSAHCGVRLEPPAWTASTAYLARQARDARTGAVVKPTLANRRHFKCVASGTSGVAEPAWNTTIGGQTDDGGVVWQAIQALSVTGTVGAVTDRRSFSDASLIEADGFWDFGVVTWTSGQNAGLKMEVESYLQAGGAVTCKLEMPFDIQAGDGYALSAGCDKSLAACRDKFDNVDNFRGHGVHLPGNEEILRYPDAK